MILRNSVDSTLVSHMPSDLEDDFKLFFDFMGRKTNITDDVKNRIIATYLVIRDRTFNTFNA